ncbi:MAG: type II toxin-antitoxin system Phd/YefM family antitoxin [Bryobacteraceae bacterium]
MEIGVRQAKAELSRLIESALSGETVIITNHGTPLARIVPEPSRPAPQRGFGFLKGSLALQPGWDSPELDQEIESMFECLQPPAKPRKRKQRGRNRGK